MTGCSSYTAEYEAIFALELALKIPIVSLRICGDSELIVKQLRREYNVKKAELVPYHKKMEQLLTEFEEVKILHMQRAMSARAYAFTA